MRFEKRVEQKLEELNLQSLEEATEGFCLQAFLAGRKTHDFQFGKTYQYYDLASLTKILFAVPTLMVAVDKKKIKLSDPINSRLEWWISGRTTLGAVLSHHAGLPAWAPFYKKYATHKKVRDEYLNRNEIQKILLKQVKGLRFRANQKSVYSDLDFILLSFLIENIFDKDLHQVWQGAAWREKLPSLHFNKNNKLKFSRKLYAPTEVCPWRKKVLRGEVHDDNTWSFGGVSSHAGLFGHIQDVSDWGLMLRAGIRGQNTRMGSTEVVSSFTRRAVPKRLGDWAYGFMMPSKGASSSGRWLSPRSVGHTGFTGTSFWYDPKLDLLVTILSNRVHPTRGNQKFVQLRPLLHDCVVEDLMSSKRI